MKPNPGNRTGLRGRILLTVGITTILIMMLMSWGILYRWRQGQIHREEATALAVSRAFSVAVIDALVYAGQGFDQPEGLLDHYVELFMTQNQRLRAITILDPQGEVVAQSYGQLPGSWVSGNLTSIMRVPGPRMVIDQTLDGSWALETIMPMHSGNHRWGVLILSFEADSIRSRIAQGFILLLLFSSAVTSILLLLLWMILGRILNSMRSLVTAMDQVDFETGFVPPLPPRDDEIGLLHLGFRQMGDRLQQSRQDVLRAEKQVWHAERLAAIGRLASGLAHEINNPINGVRNCIYAIKADPDNRAQTSEYLEMMDEGLSHASGVIEKLLGFARKQQSGLAPLVLNDAVDSVVRLVHFKLGRKNITLEIDLAENLPSVQADRQLIQEVIMNLLINAVDAVPDQGFIQIKTLSGGGNVQLAVHDQGHGIAPHIQDQIFDPFFTTKDTGEGTGLGLSISMGIIQAHGGTLEVSSTPETGTTFTIELAALSLNQDEETE
jgi:two-component system, NtrC family, sensor kinase